MSPKKPKPHVPPAPAAPAPTRKERFNTAIGTLHQAICAHFTSHGCEDPDADECRSIAWELLLAAHLHCDEADTCWMCFLQEYLKVEVKVLTEHDGEGEGGGGGDDGHDGEPIN